MKKTTTYKTNIKCNGCIATVAPVLKKSENIERWWVDLEDPDRIMTVEWKEENEDELHSLLEEAGYEASKID
ncbi:MAG: heavy-metal-associated domain-containing protein [Cyclobacteriaceae bacterium]|nr:heavy-metal-associated domain-containing protein [Cyclobacteriaceae bacterium]